MHRRQSRGVRYDGAPIGNAFPTEPLPQPDRNQTRPLLIAAAQGPARATQRSAFSPPPPPTQGRDLFLLAVNNLPGRTQAKRSCGMSKRAVGGAEGVREGSPYRPYSTVGLHRLG
jgi:hypothetical protein